MSSKIKIYSYSACNTCRKAIDWLCTNQVEHELQDIVQCPPTKKLLSDAIDQLGSRKFLFNTSGLSYRKLGSNVVKGMNDLEAIDALAADGKLIKRPFLVTDQGKILVGFKQDIWAQVLLT